MKNKGLLIGLGIVVILIFSVVSWAVSTYNGIVSLDESVATAWSQVENQYQRRADLIPNLVNTVKGVANFEKETYTAVAEARSKVNEIKLTPQMLSNPQTFKQFQSAQDNLGSALSRLLVTVEKYPELKANENFLQLQTQLEGTENRISVERMNFNEIVRQFNTTIRKFPGSLVAGFGGFSEKQYFEAAAGSEKVPEVKF